MGGFASKRSATASGCGGAGPSAALPLLPDAHRHRLRRGALHLAPRRSQRRSTPFFSNLLGDLVSGATPESLPVPSDDGACDHLLGLALPSLALASTSGKTVDLSKVEGRLIVYCYPMTGKPGVPLPAGWEEIPGAKGCTPEACGFRDLAKELEELGATVFGLSTQSREDQAEAKSRLELPFDLLSDRDLAFANALRLPTFEAGGRKLLKRLTLVAGDGRISKVFYPVFPPGEHAAEVVAWLRSPAG